MDATSCTICSMKRQLVYVSLLFVCHFLCQSLTVSQRLDRFTCERRPTHTRALKTPGDNGFSIKVVGSPPPQFYEPGKDYQVFLNGSYMNQQFVDFMLVAVRKEGSSERDTAGTFTHMLNHMTHEDEHCSHVMTSVTFHPSYKKSIAQFTWTAPPAGTGCVLFRGTVIEHPDIWYSDDGGLTKMFCEKPNEDELAAAKKAMMMKAKAMGQGLITPTDMPDITSAPHTDESLTQNRRQSSSCCACDVAKYELTFVGNWSRETHPSDFPPKQYESLLHWSDIIGASHSPSYSVWSYGKLASNGVKEVCEYGWPRSLEGEIKQQGRNVRTVIKASGIWGYPAIHTTRRTARFSTDNERPYMSLLTMVGPSPDWCIGVDSVNLCLENCTWIDNMDIDLYPWDAGTDSGVTYLSTNIPTYPRETIRPLTNTYPNNTNSPFYGTQSVKPMGTLRIRRVGSRASQDNLARCDAKGTVGDDSSILADEEDGEEIVGVADPKCMTTEWSDYTACSVTCGVGVKTRTRRFKSPMGTVKICPLIKLQEVDNCLGLVNQCDTDPNEPIDICVTTPWSSWSPCSVTCGRGTKTRTRQYLNPMGEAKCTETLTDSVVCNAEMRDCLKATMMIDWNSVCKLPMEVGTCIGAFQRFFYDTSMGKCRSFDYGGCRGNQNRFDTLEECQRTCEAILGDEDIEADTNLSGDRDCMVTEWTEFSECSVSCGTGQKSRSRMIKVRNSGNGEACPKDLYETRVCASFCSPTGSVDCMLSEWTHWSECSLTCNDGVQVRERMVKRPAEGQGRPCLDDLKEMRDCNLGTCIIEDYSQCMLSEWTDWSECSTDCGEGKMMRRRMEKRGPCPPSTLYSMAKSCIGIICESEAGNPVDCTISDWTEWTSCDKPCDMGTQTRFRMVVTPATNGGTCLLNEPKEMEKRACYIQSCHRMTLTDQEPVDCEVSEWSPWSECSKTCGTGRQIRRRTVTQRRRYGGASCPNLKEKQQCDTGVKCRRRRLKH